MRVAGQTGQPFAQPLGARDLLDADVEGVAEAAAGRVVGARLLERRREGGVERVEQQDAGAQPGGPAAQLAEVREVAVAPARPGAQRVELDGPAPGPELVREVAAPRRDDQAPAGAVAQPVQAVVAGRQVRRRSE